MKRKKWLAYLLLGVMTLTNIAGIESKAEETAGERLVSSEMLQDENESRLETVTGMDTDGNIYVFEEEEGTLKKSTAVFYSDSDSETGTQVVNLNTKGNAVTYYTEYLTGNSGYLNGAYGADAAYLGTTDGMVKFMISGVVGLVDESEVELVSLSEAVSFSYYKVVNERLVHYITQDMTVTNKVSGLDNGPAPDYLEDGITYYSYDGHYFYTEYEIMVTDYQNDVRENAVNPQNPYFNYYQFLPLRSTTVYTGEELNAILDNKVSDSSAMKGLGTTFIENQDIYGVNGLIMTGIAANESGWGTSTICLTKNNLFGLKAKDESPELSADTYISVEDCVRQFASGWMSKEYLNPDNWKYTSGILGNKAGGINVRYASDPYWGEKAANAAWTLDKLGGSKDSLRYTIGIKDLITTSHNTFNVLTEAASSSTTLYKTGKYPNYGVLILNKEASDGFYMIQSDAALSEDRQSVVTEDGIYDFDAMYAYISSGAIAVVWEGTEENAEQEESDRSHTVFEEPVQVELPDGTVTEIAGMGSVSLGGDESDSATTENPDMIVEENSDAIVEENTDVIVAENSNELESVTAENEATTAPEAGNIVEDMQRAPKTGDENNMVLWITLMGLSVIGAGIYFGKRALK